MKRQKILKMISKIHKRDVVYTGSKDKQTNLQIKKWCPVSHYNKFIRAKAGADKYLSYYSIPRKTVK
jgi:hypothetical protein